MKEIGGFIELEASYGNEYHPDAVALNRGANCLRYIIRAGGIRKVYIPYFLCGSVTKACIREGCEYEYYHIDDHFRPVFDRRLGDGERIYIVNFFGQIGNDGFESAKKKYGSIIADNAQAFYEMPIPGVDTLYSCRKFFGVPDGAYLYTDKSLNEKLETDISHSRMTHILGRYEETANEFYESYRENESGLAGVPVALMSKLTHNLLRGIDYDRARKARTDNFAYLHRELAALNKLELRVPEGAFMYPLLVRNGAELRKRLIENKIYVPTLWKYALTITAADDIEQELVNNIIPLPVDQRYGIEDMKYIICEVMKCIG